jgi:uncharacterized LabA/DUF88 family protein
MARVKKKKVAVFIDGSNFYFKLRTLIPQKMDMIHYRIRSLVQGMLDGDEQISYIGYYVGVVRNTGTGKDSPKVQDLIKSQQQLFEELRKQKIEVVRGYLLEYDGKFFEKGVDVRLATDIVTMAYEKLYDEAFIVSSDTDLIPAIVKAQSYNRRQIVHVGFEHQPSLALIRFSNRSRLITRKQAERYAAKPLQIRSFDGN